MEKAYDIKELGDMIVAECKKEGFSVAEEAVEKLGKAVYVGIKSWVIESAMKSENKIDDVVTVFFGQVDAIVLPQIEKLDLDGDKK